MEHITTGLPVEMKLLNRLIYLLIIVKAESYYSYVTIKGIWQQVSFILYLGLIKKFMNNSTYVCYYKLN
jgi:hypothetical protein